LRCSSTRIKPASSPTRSLQNNGTRAHSFPGDRAGMGLCQLSSSRRLFACPRLTPVSPSRSLKPVMKDSLHRYRSPGVMSAAIVTALAVLIAPFCGRICAASSGCENGTAMAESRESCHRTTVLTSSESGCTTAQASSRFCSQHELPAVLVAEQKLSALLRSSTLAASLSGTAQTKYIAPDLIANNPGWRHDGHPTQAAVPSTDTSVLRI
jgi:hypothetical protein